MSINATSALTLPIYLLSSANSISMSTAYIMILCVDALMTILLLSIGSQVKNSLRWNKFWINSVKLMEIDKKVIKKNRKFNIHKISMIYKDFIKLFLVIEAIKVIVYNTIW